MARYWTATLLPGMGAFLLGYLARSADSQPHLLAIRDGSSPNPVVHMENGGGIPFDMRYQPEKWKCTTRKSQTEKQIDAPLMDDCLAVIDQIEAMSDFSLLWTTGCVQVTQGTCTGSVCPQISTTAYIPSSVAAQRLRSPLLEKCIANGQRGWWAEGQEYGIGLYLS